jgi:predicted PurR-regulated permease PerM
MKNIITFDVKFSAIFKVIFSVFLIWLAIELRALVLTVFIAFIVATAIRPVVGKVQKYKIPRSISIPVIYLIIIFTFSLMIFIIGKTLTTELIALGKDLPSIINNLQSQIPFFAQFDLSSYTENTSTALASLGKDFGGNINLALKAFNNVFDIFTSLLTMIVISLYLTLDLDGIMKNITKFVPKENRDQFMKIYFKVEDQVGAWLRGQLFLMLLIGVIMYIILKVLGVPFALPLAIFAGLMEILPIIGPLVFSAVMIIVAFTVSPFTAITVAIACLITQQLEAHVIVPLTMKKAVGLSPVTTIIAIIAGGTLLGVIGALLAVPIAAVISAVIQDLYAVE